VQSDGTFSFSGTASLNPGGWGQMASASVTWTNTSLAISGSINTPVGAASIWGSLTPTSYHLTGSGSLGLGGFTLASASVTLDSASGLYASGSVNVPGAGSVALAGYVQLNGYFGLSGSGSLAPGGFQLASASFSLTKNASGTTFAASGALHLGNATVASASVSISSDGSFSGSGMVSLGGVTVSASVSISSGGAVSLSGSISIDATYSGYGIVGTLSVSASSNGQVSASMDFSAKVGGQTVFSGSASVNSSGKATFKACVCGYSWCCVSVTIWL
jgi:fibronectin-binding autotransporter adhesin